MAATTATGAVAEAKLPDKFEPVAEVTRRYRKEIDALRAKLTDPGPYLDDIALYRLLKGWKFDEAKAAQVGAETVKWRKELKLDALRPIARAEQQRQFPHFDKFVRVHPHNISHRLDRSGQPISIECIGRADPAMLVRTVKLSEMMEYQYHHMENKAQLASELTAQTGTVIRNCKIMDLNGLGRRHMNRAGLAYLKHILHITQLHYPEMMGNLWIVNAPAVFNLIWKIVKPWLNEQTLSKVTILGTDYKETLHKAIDPANLPDFLGGTCTSCPGGCVTMIHPDEGMTIVTLAAKYSESCKVPIEEKDTLVTWEFRTRQYDIGFQVNFVKNDGKVVPVLPQAKYDSFKETIQGEYVATEPGVLLLLWDNNHSRFYSKTLLYKTTTTRAEPDPPTSPSSPDDAKLETATATEIPTAAATPVPAAASPTPSSPSSSTASESVEGVPSTSPTPPPAAATPVAVGETA